MVDKNASDSAFVKLWRRGQTKVQPSPNGSVAHHFSDVIKDISAEKGIKLGKIVEKPIADLVSYHGFGQHLGGFSLRMYKA